MSTTIIPKYVVTAYSVNGKGVRVCDTLVCWKGKASQKKLEELRESYNQSFNPGGVNFCLSKSLGYCPHYYRMDLVVNRTNRVVLTANAPAFEVV